ncbi:MAG TPA: fatty acid--CoA ligase family protein [Gemmatimonadaceae bacterium]|nr:fatty acid--CoA ligase family protein [Gemmatimonadaceae bacterium]
MAGLLDDLARRQGDRERPFLIGPSETLSFAQIEASAQTDDPRLDGISAGDIVAVVGDFDADSIALAFRLLDMGAILMPLTPGTEADHEYFFESGLAQYVIRGKNRATRKARRDTDSNELIREIRSREHPGVIFFSSGTTGRPKAILHDFQNFVAKFATARPALRTLNFLLFDHAGGINTLLHTLFNKGVVIVPAERAPEAIANDVRRHSVELLPATPTFLRMMLLAGVFDAEYPSLRVVTYGTERMDQSTLDTLCAKLPNVDFRQTYGLSELGVFQVRSRARDSLWMKIGGEGIETRIVDGVLHIRSANRMLGYLNAPSPFIDGWYDTGDIVEEEEGFIKVVGRAKEVINVGGLKILPGEVERIALLYPGVLRAKAHGVTNPITGQHIELVAEPAPGADLDRRKLMTHFRAHLQKQLCPHRITIGTVPVSHRFKQQ